MSKPDWYNNNLGRLIIVIAFLTILIGPLLVYSEYGTGGIEVVSVTITGLLTLSLVVLYFQQYTILERQTDLQEREYRSALSQFGKSIAEDDTIKIRLKNKGRGKITSMYLKSEITSDTEELDIGYGRTVFKNSNTDSLELLPNSDFEEFIATVRLRVLSGDDSERYFQFKHIAQRLVQRGLDSCTLRLTLEVIDEGISNENFSAEIELAEQELELNKPEITTKTNSEGEEIKIKTKETTTVEEGIPFSYSVDSGICTSEFHEIFTDS